MPSCSSSKDDLEIIWFSKILRWVLGAGFVSVGIIYMNRGAWPAIAFGLVIFLTGFLKPVRCIHDPYKKDA